MVQMWLRAALRFRGAISRVSNHWDHRWWMESAPYSYSQDCCCCSCCSEYSTLLSGDVASKLWLQSIPRPHVHPTTTCWRDRHWMNTNTIFPHLRTPCHVPHWWSRYASTKDVPISIITPLASMQYELIPLQTVWYRI